MTGARSAVRKAVVYATSARGVLVHHEPDFPDVPLQIPGGTVEPGEGPASAAVREFHEETGFAAPVLHPLGVVDLVPDFPCPHDRLVRHFFHGHFDVPPPAGWEHIEAHASDGSGPILFRFFWLPKRVAAARLGLRLGALLFHLEGDTRVP